jgi:hypothetical protein
MRATPSPRVVIDRSAAMPIQFILLPLFVEVALVFTLLFAMAFARRSDFNSGRVHPRDVALGQLAWTPKTQQVSNAFRNQFELPTLFYVLTILVIATRHADVLFVVMAWVFVLLRIAHVYIFVTNNRVMLRGGVYGLGALVLMAMWLIFAIRILFGLP